MILSVGGPGPVQLNRLAVKAKSTDPKIARRLNKGIRGAVKPTIAVIKGPRGIGRLPSGLAAWMGDIDYTVRIKHFGRTAGVRVVSKKGHANYDIDKGRNRHPVHGNRKVWVAQSVTPGFFSDVVDEEAQNMLDAVGREFKTFAKELQV